MHGMRDPGRTCPAGAHGVCDAERADQLLVPRLDLLDAQQRHGAAPGGVPAHSADCCAVRIHDRVGVLPHVRQAPQRAVQLRGRKADGHVPTCGWLSILLEPGRAAARADGARWRSGWPACARGGTSRRSTATQRHCVALGIGRSCHPGARRGAAPAATCSSLAGAHTSRPVVLRRLQRKENPLVTVWYLQCCSSAFSQCRSYRWVAASLWLQPPAAGVREGGHAG